MTQPPIPAPAASRLATPNSIPLAAKRYDRASGPAVFTGCIPLKPGQLFDTALASVTLWDGVTEIGITVSALWPRHPDGSVKVIRVSATLNLAAATPHDYTLRLGTARTQSGPPEPAITGAWMRNPRLMACTDAAHLCASRTAPLPLVPIPHPNLPAQWNKFLTTEWDDPNTPYPSWGRIRARVMADDHSRNLGGSANYNFISALYYKYMTSGDLDRLNEAHHAAQFGSAERLYNGGIPISLYGCCYGSNFSPAPYTNDGNLNGVVFYGEPWDGHAAGSRFDANPDGWADLPRGAGPVTGTEWYSGVETDLLMMYQLSGWEQAKGAFLCRALELFGRRGFPDNPGTVPLDNVLQSNLGSSVIRDNHFKGNYGGRSQWRAWRGADLLYYVLSPPMALYHHRAAWKASTIPSPRTHKADWRLWVKREHPDFYERYSNRYVEGHWLRGSGWSTPGWSPPSKNLPQGLPFFQLSLFIYDLMLAHLNVAPDPRTEAFIVGTAQRLKQCLRGPEPTRKTPGMGYKLPYCAPSSYTNNPTNRPNVAVANDGFWGTTINLAIFALHHRITGEGWARDVADMHASNTRIALASGDPAGYSTPKEMGECYSQAFHAAAWRAGIPVDGWDVP
jgi:hypothetical protein